MVRQHAARRPRSGPDLITLHCSVLVLFSAASPRSAPICLASVGSHVPPSCSVLMCLTSLCSHVPHLTLFSCAAICSHVLFQQSSARISASELSTITVFTVGVHLFRLRSPAECDCEHQVALSAKFQQLNLNEELVTPEQEVCVCVCLLGA